ncbi:unnamed protein product [Paramecium primaurelia]|uniref:BART domain-containing protein n=1 Tax=Paramecium primaurelia TaxID=5886 RepID=A0A8S1MEN6_PARPR|nr:unnamed protein product [Paramecium primaurelia]
MSSDYLTVKEIILQMLASPTWQNQYNSFVDEYCIYFDDDEENSIQQNNIFKQFQTEMAVVYDSFFSSLGLDNSDELQIQVIKEILNSDGEEEIDVQQLLALGDFQVFKAEMSYQNKRREIAAYQQLVDDEEEEEDDEGEQEDEQNPLAEQAQKMLILKIKLEYEQLQEVLELKQAMQISLDTPNQKKLELISQLLEVVQARLQILEKEEEGMQQKQQMTQDNDRKAKLLAQLNDLPLIDLQKEQEIFTKIQIDVDKI